MSDTICTPTQPIGASPEVLVVVLGSGYSGNTADYGNVQRLNVAADFIKSRAEQGRGDGMFAFAGYSVETDAMIQAKEENCGLNIGSVVLPATTTIEAIAGSVRFAESAGAKELCIATHDYHADRARRIAQYIAGEGLAISSLSPEPNHVTKSKDVYVKLKEKLSSAAFVLAMRMGKVERGNPDKAVAAYQRMTNRSFKLAKKILSGIDPNYVQHKNKA